MNVDNTPPAKEPVEIKQKLVNRQRFASILGIVIVAYHIALTAYLYLVLGPVADERLAVSEIALPITVSYAISVVSWFIATRGIITSNEGIGYSFVIIILMVVAAFLVALPVGLYLYDNNKLTPPQLNDYFAYTESALGGMFVLIFNFMFERQDATPDSVSAPENTSNGG